jgi:hypothetical protein
MLCRINVPYWDGVVVHKSGVVLNFEECPDFATPVEPEEPAAPADPLAKPKK